MKKILFATALLVTASFSYANPVHINSQSLSQLQWQDVPYSQSVKTQLSTQQNQAFTTHFAGTESPVAAYRIPANQGTLTIEITSPVIDKQLFVPSAVILDGKFNIAATYPSSTFTFQEERGLKPNRLEAELSLTPVAGQDYIYLLIYTTAQDLSKTTMMPHPAKVFAKATGKQPPAIPDIEVTHSRQGEIIVNVTHSQGTQFIGLPNTLFEKKPATPIGKVQPIMPPAQAVTTPVDKETEAYFNQAVKNALKQNDINRALNLVNEAEKLGLTTPRKIFLQQVSSK
ncbi:maltose operon protein MalM [Pasteurella oralis]|uniref:maltose operon protein MalM n=1 Tax=Pasteurella oralis TaxID=1071947 RepID=UPI000C7D261C|nr:maltose operon protein MalM [Pasteurella oralis]